MFDLVNRGPEKFHSEDVERLSPCIFGAHVDFAVDSEPCAGRGGGDAMLSGPGFGNDSLLAHAFGQEHLADGVVDLVGTGVGKVFPLQPDVRSARNLAEPRGMGEGGWSADEVTEFRIHGGLEFGIGAGLVPGGLQLIKGDDKCFGDVASAERTESTGRWWG